MEKGRKSFKPVNRLLQKETKLECTSELINSLFFLHQSDTQLMLDTALIIVGLQECVFECVFALEESRSAVVTW